MDNNQVDDLLDALENDSNSSIINLVTILPIRLILDGIAAITMLKQEKGIQHLTAIIRAHFAFYLSIPKLIIKRRDISQKSNLIGKMKISIIIKNKIQGINNFSDL